MFHNMTHPCNNDYIRLNIGIARIFWNPGLSQLPVQIRLMSLNSSCVLETRVSMTKPPFVFLSRSEKSVIPPSLCPDLIFPLQVKERDRGYSHQDHRAAKIDHVPLKVSWAVVWQVSPGGNDGPYVPFTDCVCADYGAYARSSGVTDHPSQEKRRARESECRGEK